ncbi:MAG: S4 domain-containing protein YaaA [Candidatus Izemoplasmatales bacterium]|jgi:S4 domain protein YaaA|nr:S4 domain-containing protein YaaA [Candidatus Izemoplasmatales bacterium]
MNIIQITTPYITLGQLLKFANIISSGGETKPFLLENVIVVNDDFDNRRGRKLYPGDTIKVNEKLFFQIEKKV